MNNCAICGTELARDLFAYVTQEPVCAICKLKYIGGLPTSAERIASVRKQMGLEDGQFLQQDNGEEARKILGR